MSSQGFSLTVEGMADLLNSFEKVERGVLDLRQLGTWDWVESQFRKIQKEIFDSQGSAGKGGTWAPLSPAYAKVKSRIWGNKPILQASGGMYQEFTSVGGGDVDKQAQELSITFSSPAGYHMSTAARSKIPYRTSLEMTEGQETRLTEPIIKKLKQLIDNAKLRDIRGF